MTESLFNDKGQPRFWWSQLMAIPPSKHGRAYSRLNRVWFDQTGTRNNFRKSNCEVHLVCTLFENMVLFSPVDWLPALMETAGILDVPAGVADCSWSYEFEDEANVRFNDKGNKRKPPIADIVIHGCDESGDFICVIEAKRREGGPKLNDLDPDYYLDSPTFRPFARQYMLYLLDEADAGTSPVPVAHDRDHRGILTWQQLGGIQIRQAQRIDAPDESRRFMAAAIHRQFTNHGIMPDEPADQCLCQPVPHEDLPCLEARFAHADTPEDWSAFAGDQIASARSLDLPQPLPTFLAGALQYHFCQRSIWPAVHAAPYLNKKMDFDSMPQSDADGGQATWERRDTYWHLGWGGEQGA